MTELCYNQKGNSKQNCVKIPSLRKQQQRSEVMEPVTHGLGNSWKKKHSRKLKIL